MNDLSMHIMDIVYNSIKAHASLVEIAINYTSKNDILKITIYDNGDGIDQTILNDVKSPFTTSRSTRSVGLGISLFELSAKQANGSLDITSELGEYTKVEVVMEKGHIDCLPYGNIGEAIYLLTINNEGCEIVLQCCYDDNCFKYDSAEVREIVGDNLISDIEVIEWIKAYVNENMQEINLI